MKGPQCNGSRMKAFVLATFDSQMNAVFSIESMDFTLKLWQAIQRRAQLYLEYCNGRYVLWELTEKGASS